MATKTKSTVKTVPVTSTKTAKGSAATKVVATAKSAPKVRTLPKTRKASKAHSSIGTEQRRHYVEVAAFFIAERRSFAPGDLMADWLAAERQVDGLIAEGKIGA